MRRRDSGSSKNSRRFGSSKKDMGRTCVGPATAHSRDVANRSAAPFPDLPDKKTIDIMERKGEIRNGSEEEKRERAAAIR